jgi:hypothetical protein
MISAERLVTIYQIRKTAKEHFKFNKRFASDFGPAELACFTEEVITKTAGLGFIKTKINQIYTFFQRIPELWGKIKETWPVKSVSELPAVLKKIIALGRHTIEWLKTKFKTTFPFALFYTNKKSQNELEKVADKINKSLDDQSFLKKTAGKNLNKVWNIFIQVLPMISRTALLALSVVTAIMLFQHGEDLWNSSWMTTIKSLISAKDLKQWFIQIWNLAPKVVKWLFAILFGATVILPILKLAKLLYDLIWKGYIVWMGDKIKILWATITKDETKQPEIIQLSKPIEVNQNMPPALVMREEEPRGVSEDEKIITKHPGVNPETLVSRIVRERAITNFPRRTRT